MQLGLLLDDSYGYGAYTRGWMLSLTVDRVADRDPGRRPRLRPAVPQESGAWSSGSRGCSSSRTGCCCSSRCGCQPIVAAARCSSRSRARARRAAFVSVGPIVGAVAPYRMRTQAFALIPVFIFLMGGFFGGHPRRRALRRPRRAHRPVDRRAHRRARSAACCSSTARATSSATSRWRSRSCSRSRRRSSA